MNVLKNPFRGLLIVSLCLVFAAVSLAQEKRVKMKDLPAPVQKTVREQSKGATIKGLSKEVEDGKTLYEVELAVSGHSKDVTMDSSGTVVEVEEQVQLSSLPEAVQTAIKQSAGSAPISMIESVVKGGTLQYYEIHIRKNGKKSEIKIGTDGKQIT